MAIASISRLRAASVRTARDVAGVDVLAAVVPLLGIFLVSRLAVLLVAVILEATLPLAYHGLTYSRAPILTSLTGEDAVYYLGIAADGYHLAPIHDQFVDWVYFPAFPAIVRVVAFATGDVAVAGVLVANVAALIALGLVYVLSRERLDEELALRATALVALAPGAVAFTMAYSDSLLLAAIAGAMLAAERRHHLVMAALFVLATLSRPPGVLFGLPLAALLLTRERSGRSLLWLFGGPLALVGFSAYQGAVLGDPLAWVHAQSRWNLAPALGPTQSATAAGATAPLTALLFFGLLVYASLLALAWRSRQPLPYLLVGVVALSTVFAAGRLQSDLRYLAIAWPLAWVIATRVRVAASDLTWATLGSVYVVFAFLNFTQALAP